MSTDQETDFLSNRSRYGIEKLREGNYHEWVWNIQSLLEEAKIWHYVTGAIPRPAEDGKSPVEDVLKWKELDAKARRTIGFCVSGPLQLPVRLATSAKEAWDELAAIHAPQDRQTQLHLTRELHMCKMLASTSLKDHEATFSSIIESLAATGKIMDKMDAITMYLLSLSEEYSSFAREVNTVITENTTFSQVKGLVRVEQQRLQNLKPDQSASTSDGSVKAHYANGKRFFKGKSNNNGQNNNVPNRSNHGSDNRSDNGSDNGSNNGAKKGNCHHCGSSGHYDGPNNGNNNAYKKGNCNYCGIPGHYEYECRKKVNDQQYKSNANIASNRTYGGLAYVLQAVGDNKVIKDSSIHHEFTQEHKSLVGSINSGLPAVGEGPNQSVSLDCHEFTQKHKSLVGGINSGLPAVGEGRIFDIDDNTVKKDSDKEMEETSPSEVLGPGTQEPTLVAASIAIVELHPALAPAAPAPVPPVEPPAPAPAAPPPAPAPQTQVPPVLGLPASTLIAFVPAALAPIPPALSVPEPPSAPPAAAANTLPPAAPPELPQVEPVVPPPPPLPAEPIVTRSGQIVRPGSKHQGYNVLQGRNPKNLDQLRSVEAYQYPSSFHQEYGYRGNSFCAISPDQLDDGG